MNGNALEKIHETTLRLLENVGLRLEHDEIVARLLKAGARPGPGPQEVRFPREMIADYLALAPTVVPLAGRDGTVATLTADSPSVFWTNPAMYILDGQKRREITCDDLARVARLCDHLESVQGIVGVALSDVPSQHRDFVGLRVIAENSGKHIRVLCFTARGAEALVRMKPIFPGAWFSMGFTAHGPLRWTHLALDIFLKSAGHGIPLTINGEPMAGVTGPVTMAGSMAVGNAEILAGIVVCQVLEPGRPVVHNLGLAHTFDMKHAVAVTGGPENAFYAKASAALGRFYRLPSASWASTESVHEDEQAAFEKMFALHTHLEQGVSLIWGLGQLESEKTLSLAQLVMDDEMVRFARHYQAGFEIGDEELQYDLIRQVGIAGNFLDTEHTLDNFRNALYAPGVLNRAVRENCPGPLPEVAHRQAMAILEADTMPKIGGPELAELKRIERAFRLE